MQILILFLIVIRLHTVPYGAIAGVVQCAMLRVHEDELRRKMIKTETSNCVKQV